MIKLERTNIYGWEPTIRGMRNPMESWDKSDSDVAFHASENFAEDDPMAEKYRKWNDIYGMNIKIGPNDHDLMMKLAKAGSVEAKYRRMITVSVDICAPLYWWKEFDTYKVGTVANSCSTMHRIHAKEFTLDDFSCEHLNFFSKNILNAIIKQLNWCRETFNTPNDQLDMDVLKKLGCETKKDLWYQMIQLLPSSYNQMRTIMLNYEVLANIYKNRKDHKLDEWCNFCEWIENLPYSEFITV